MSCYVCVLRKKYMEELNQVKAQAKLTLEQIEEEVMRKIPFIERERECQVTKHQRQYDRNVYKAELIRQNA